MRFALVDNQRASPQPGLLGVCCYCGRRMISKCGRYVRWHWAHERRSSCDPWQENETEWHMAWKDRFPKEFQEVIHIDDMTKEKHIADVKTGAGTVVEVQHSRISDSELQSREDFYGNMIWIVDARDKHGWFLLGTSSDPIGHDPLCYHFEWWSRGTLVKRWSEARKPVFFDTLFRSKYTEGIELGSDNHALWRLLEFDTKTNRGVIAPVRADWVIEAALNGGDMPLMGCEEQDLWRYRREMVQVDSIGATSRHSSESMRRDTIGSSPGPNEQQQFSLRLSEPTEDDQS